MITSPVISWLAVAPEVSLAVGAVLVLLIDVQWKPATRVLGTVFTSVLVAAATFSVWQWLWVDGVAGDRSQMLPFAEMIAVDRFAVFARCVLLVATALGVAAGWKMFESLGRRAAEALALILLATLGFGLMAASTQLVMMFVALEVGSISLYVLAGITRERTESDEAAIKYFLMGAFASAIFVYGVALVYASTGAFSLIAIREFLGDFLVTNPAVLLIGLALIVAGLGFKVTAAPFHSWAPDVYQGAPTGVVGYMAAVAKVGGFAALARVLITAFPTLVADWAPVVAAVATLSMAVGAILALVQDDVKRMLAYSGVAHAGFILTGVVGGATTGLWFYLAVYSVQLVGAFAVVAAVTGSTASRSAIADYSGLGTRSPFLAASFSVLLLGMAGLPVTSGFVAKFGVFQEAWAAGYSWLVIVAVVASVVALAFYLRIIVKMYMEEGTETPTKPAMGIRAVLGVAVAATIVFGIFPSALLELARDAIAF